MLSRMRRRVTASSFTVSMGQRTDRVLFKVHVVIG
jgi:hypothetical protein